MKTIFGIFAMMFAFTVNATDICANGKVVYSGDLANNAGSEKLCVLTVTNTWYLGTKDKNETEYTYAQLSNVKGFTHSKGDETMKGYEVTMDGDKIILAAIYKGGKLVQSIIAAKNMAMEFKPETMFYIEHK